MSILCATNFSEESLTATTVAAELARQRGEDLWLVFVTPESTQRAFGEAAISTADATLKGEAARVRKLGATVTHALLLGKLHQEVPRFVAENKVGLVVAGDTRKAPNFLGTGTLARLAQHLEAPLWVVRDGASAIAWARGERKLKVMLALDRSESTAIAARWVEQLGKFGKLELIGAHVYWPTVEAQRMGLPLPHPWDELQPQVLESLQRELSGMLPTGFGQRIRVVPALGRASDHLNTLAGEEGVDLLVLGTHRRQALGQLWSVSEQCLQLAPTSVVSVPGGAAAPAPMHGLERVDRALAASDFSPTSKRAAVWALSLVAAGGNVELIHVVPGPLGAAEEKNLRERLLAMVPPEVKGRRLKISAHVLVGTDVARTIAAAGERFNSQLVCVGSRGHSGLVEWVLGSTAKAVLSSSGRPVLIVHPTQP